MLLSCALYCTRYGRVASFIKSMMTGNYSDNYHCYPQYVPHVKRTAEKAAQQSRALTATAGSTWGATFAKARLIYSAVVRPAITYGATIWAPTEGLLRPANRRWIGDALERRQQGCLRTVTGGYKATSRQQLEAEAAVPPLRAHIARLQLQACARIEASGVQAKIQEACARIQRQLAPRRGRRRHRPGITPGQHHQQWAKTILWPRRTMEDSTARLGIPLWSDGPPPPPTVTTPNTPLPRSVWQAYQLAEQWCWECWHQLHGGPPPTTQTLDPDPGGGDNWKLSKMPYQSALRLHASLSKAQSSILTQVRTGKIGLVAFLCKRRVPGFPTPACSCGAPWETAKHVVLDCPHLLRARRSLYLAAATTDYQALTSRPRPTTALTAWILRQGILPQFSWAQEQLEAGC